MDYSDYTIDELKKEWQIANRELEIWIAMADFAEQDTRDAEAARRKMVDAGDEDSIESTARFNAMKTMARRWKETLTETEKAHKHACAIWDVIELRNS